VSKQNELLHEIHCVLKEIAEQLPNIGVAVNGVTDALNKQTLQLARINKIMALDATKLANLFQLLTQLLATLPSDAATIKSLQDQIATMTANDAALDALAPQLDTLIAGVTAAEPPVVSQPPAVAAFDPTVNYQPGQEASNPDGSVWTAVTPVLGEAPGVTPGNWTQNDTTAVTAAARSSTPSKK
jgi:hypothetical protein